MSVYDEQLVTICGGSEGEHPIMVVNWGDDDGDINVFLDTSLFLSAAYGESFEKHSAEGAQSRSAFFARPSTSHERSAWIKTAQDWMRDEGTDSVDLMMHDLRPMPN